MSLFRWWESSRTNNIQDKGESVKIFKQCIEDQVVKGFVSMQLGYYSVRASYILYVYIFWLSIMLEAYDIILWS